MTWTATAYLDVNDRHPELYGDCILLRDDDGMGFSLCDDVDGKPFILKGLIGKNVRISIEEIPPYDKGRYWKTDAEKVKTGAPVEGLSD